MRAMRVLNRRAVLQVAGSGAVALAAACVSGTAPAVPRVSLARSGAAQPAAPPGAVQGQESAQPVPPAQDSPWTTHWEDIVAAAEREGTLSLLTVVGRGYRSVIERFEQAFPGISVQHGAESSPTVWLGTARQARRASSAAFDVALVHPDRALAEGGPEGMWAPVRPLLFRPDVLDDGAWRGGVGARFLDVGVTLCFDWEYQVIHAYAINTDLVQPGEITTVTDLLDRKWKGKILASDPRIGGGLLSAASVAKSWGTDVLKRLLVDQRPTFSRGGPSQVTEALVRGRHPIALGVRPKALNPFREQGLGHNVEYLDLPDADFVATNSLLYFDRAPHPAAAALFANWILTHEAQTILTGGLRTNSARTDVEAFEPDGIGMEGKTYYEQDREANYAHTAATQQFVNGLLGHAP
ncbi:MAG: ABC transporter substrate-binding protein [Chloroflexi bacterium]|nr:ABC transporter substrate-binding protein [Chloroflexota bacterium]